MPRLTSPRPTKQMGREAGGTDLPVHRRYVTPCGSVSLPGIGRMASVAQERLMPGLAAAWWTAVVGAIFNGLSLLDRTVIAVVLPEIRHDLDLTAFQISAVQGIGF